MTSVELVIWGLIAFIVVVALTQAWRANSSNLSGKRVFDFYTATLDRLKTLWRTFRWNDLPATHVDEASLPLPIAEMASTNAINEAVAPVEAASPSRPDSLAVIEADSTNTTFGLIGSQPSAGLPEAQPIAPLSSQKITSANVDTHWSLGLGLLAAVLALIGQFYFSFLPMELLNGVVFFSLAIGLFLVLAQRSEAKSDIELSSPFQVHRSDRSSRSTLAQQWSEAIHQIYEQPLRVVLTVIGIAISYTVARLLIVRPSAFSYPSILLIWLASILCFVFAVARFSRAGLLRRLYNKFDLLAIVGLTILGGMLRFWALGALPDIISGDEGQVGMLAKSVLKGEITNMFATTYGHGTTYLFIMAGFFKLLGSNPLGLRFTSALGGMLTIPALYLLARRMFSTRVAFIAAGLLAVSHFHLHFSRIIPSGNIQDALFTPLILYFFLTGLEEKSINRFIISAVLLGLHLYVYMGARLIVLLLPIYVGFLSIIDRELTIRNLNRLLVFASAFIIVSVPMAVWVYQRPDDFMARANQVGIIQSGWLANEAVRLGKSQFSIFIQQFWDAILTVNYFPAKGFYYSKLPMLDFVAGSAFILGLVYSLRHTFDRRHLMLQGWFWSAILMGGALVILTRDAAYRIMILFPAVCVFVALGFDRLIEFSLKGISSRPIHRILLTAIFMAAIGVLNFKAYFVDYLPSCSYEDWGTRFASKMGAYLGELGPSYTPYLLGAPRIYYGIHRSVDFLSGSVPVINVNDSLVGPPDFVSPRSPAVFFLIPERTQELDFIEQYMPGGEALQLTDCGRPQMLIYKFNGR